MLTEREKDAALWSAMGAYEAMATDDHLGDAARRCGARPRTLKGDVFEHAFEWARQKKRDTEVLRDDG